MKRLLLLCVLVAGCESQPVDDPTLTAEIACDLSLTVVKPKSEWGAGLGDTALLIVTLPAQAKLFVNGQPTDSTGSVRPFMAHGLEPGKEYEYRIRVEVDGRSYEATVTLAAGQHKALTFPARSVIAHDT